MLLVAYSLLVTFYLIKIKNILNKATKENMILKSKIDINSTINDLTSYVDFYLNNDFEYNIFIKSYISNTRLTENDFDKEINRAVKEIYTNMPNRIRYQFENILNFNEKQILTVIVKIVRSKLINIYNETNKTKYTLE